MSLRAECDHLVIGLALRRLCRRTVITPRLASIPSLLLKAALFWLRLVPPSVATWANARHIVFPGQIQSAIRPASAFSSNLVRRLAHGSKSKLHIIVVSSANPYLCDLVGGWIETLPTVFGEFSQRYGKLSTRWNRTNGVMITKRWVATDINSDCRPIVGILIHNKDLAANQCYGGMNCRVCLLLIPISVLAKRVSLLFCGGSLYPRSILVVALSVLTDECDPSVGNIQYSELLRVCWLLNRDCWLATWRQHRGKNTNDDQDCRSDASNHQWLPTSDSRCGRERWWLLLCIQQSAQSQPFRVTLLAIECVASDLAAAPHRAQLVNRIRAVIFAALVYVVSHKSVSRLTMCRPLQCGLTWFMVARVNPCFRFVEQGFAGSSTVAWLAAKAALNFGRDGALCGSLEFAGGVAAAGGFLSQFGAKTGFVP